MEKINKSSVVFNALLFYLFFSCTTNEETTVVLLGEESYIKSTYEIIPDTLLHQFEVCAGTIHTGFIPPNIEGEYLINPKQRVHTNVSHGWPLNVIEPEVKITISDQHNRVCVIKIDEFNSVITDTAYISGSGDLFSIYLTEEKHISHSGYNTYITREIIFNGEIVENGIKDLYMANIIIDVGDSSNGHIIQYNKGDMFIYKDKDAFSERIE